MKEKNDYVVLSPIGYKDALVGVRLERMELSSPSEVPDVVHSGQGIHSGIIVRSAQNSSDLSWQVTKNDEKPFSVDLKVGLHHGPQNVHQEVCHDCLDYGNFLMRLAKLLKRRFTQIQVIDLEIKVTSSEKTCLEVDDMTTDPADASYAFAEPLKIGDVQELLEHAFPNGMGTAEIASTLNSSCAIVEEFLSQLEMRGVITHLESDQWIRVDKDADFQNAMGKQMPKVNRSDRPTVAIVTALYAEKLAVDAMLQNRRTYVRYKSDGESNVYTLGNIGSHRVVSTKLSVVGQSRSEKISAGSITTRLLGGFPEVEHVFVVGVGGLAPNSSDGDGAVHLGDVVVSAPASSQYPYAYIICDSLQRNRDSNQLCMYARYSTADNIARTFDDSANWDVFSSDCLDAIHNAAKDTEFSFNRPSVNVDGQQPARSNPAVNSEKSKLHLGPIAASKIVFKHQVLKDDFTRRFGLIAFDAGFDT
ncbi:hypothetical protein TTRE_0000569101, partial [Trichuris trichiura]